MASDSYSYCIVCSEVTLFTDSTCLDKFDALFFLRILLELPENSKVIYQAQLPLNLLPICDNCGITVKQSREIYTEISKQIQKFQGLQNNILSKIRSEVAFRPHLSYKYNGWVEQCRQLVKNHNVQAFKYPFIFHDLNKLLKSFPGSCPLTDYTTDPATEIPITTYSAQIQSFEDPLQCQTEYLNDEDKDNDISDKYESSEEDDSPSQPQFYYNSFFRQFHCSVAGCTTVNKVKTHIERHIRREHARKFGTTPKPSYTCSWPSCGKIFKKKINHQSHIHKHRGTPSLKCDKCGQLFYYRRGLLSHQSRNNCTRIHEPAIISNNMGNSISQTFVPPQLSTSSLISTEAPCGITNVSWNTAENTEQSNYCQNNSQVCENISASCVDSTVPSSTIEITGPFLASNVSLTLKEEPQFENEDDECNSNKSDENTDLSEDDAHENSNSHHPTDEQATISTSNETDNKLNHLTCSWPGCSDVFCDKLSLSCHMDRHRGTPKQKCEQCDQLFYSAPELLNHKKQQHRQPTTIQNPNPANNSSRNSSSPFHSSLNPTNLDEVIIKVIRESEEEDNDKDNFEMDERSSEDSDYEDSGTSSNDSEPSSSKKATTFIRQKIKSEHKFVQNSKGLFVCTWPNCKRTMSCKPNIRSHMDQHQGTPHYNCIQCTYKCYWRSDLVKHVSTKHETINITKYERGLKIKKVNYNQDPTTGRYICPDNSCNITYKNLRQMKDHYRVEHLKIKEKSGFVCEYDECNGRLFSSRGYWQAHMDIHKGTPSFKCDKCNLMFYWKHNLVSHQRKQHSKNKVQNKKKKCLVNLEVQETRKVIKSSGQSEYDLRHDPLTGRYHCLDIGCSKTSVSKAYIIQHYEQEHLRIKEKESFPCDWPGCGKIIGDRQSWQAHMDRHNGTPQFECDECDAKFYWRNGMIGHKRTKHGVKRKKKNRVIGERVK